MLVGMYSGSISCMVVQLTDKNKSPNEEHPVRPLGYEPHMRCFRHVRPLIKVLSGDVGLGAICGITVRESQITIHDAPVIPVLITNMYIKDQN